MPSRLYPGAVAWKRVDSIETGRPIAVQFCGNAIVQAKLRNAERGNKPLALRGGRRSVGLGVWETRQFKV